MLKHILSQLPSGLKASGEGFPRCMHSTALKRAFFRARCVMAPRVELYTAYAAHQKGVGCPWEAKTGKGNT